MSSRIWIWNVGQGRCSHSILERSRAWLGHGISSGTSNDFHSYNLNQIKWCNYRCPRVLFSIVGTSKKTKEDNTPGVRTSSIGKRIPLLTPLLILNFADYRSIVKLMNLSWTWIFASWIKTRVWPLEHSNIINFMKEVFPLPHKCSDFRFCQEYCFEPNFFNSIIDITNFWCRKIESNLALVLNFLCQKFKVNSKEILWFNFWR